MYTVSEHFFFFSHHCVRNQSDKAYKYRHHDSQESTTKPAI